jgi:hypothetical protein
MLNRDSFIAGVVMPVDGGWAARITSREPELSPLHPKELPTSRGAIRAAPSMARSS